MLVLGIEGTAHTVSAGVIDEENILSNESSTFSAGNGGIHPREAAVHHSDKIVPVIKRSLEQAHVSMKDIDLVAYSRGPGLGPCLRVVGTAARSIAVNFEKKIIGVNHPLGHVEIGRRLGRMEDPIVLYVSGGNTQVLAHTSGRYRVMGETMDIGLGNMLDKFARDIGIGFPGGPIIEKLAREGNNLLELPYSVKGMDTSFSGIYTAAKALLGSGESKEDVSFSIQETSFSMLVEVLERALYYFNKSEILLAGGVAANSRLRQMLSVMAEETGIRLYLTDRKYCMDNGAMIAQAGLLMHKHGARHDVSGATVDQKFRIDEVDTPWIMDQSATEDRMRGAESVISREEYLGRSIVVKRRQPKKYRINRIDERILKERTRNEASLLIKIRDAGINAPVVYNANLESHELMIQDLGGMTLRKCLKTGECHAGIVEDVADLVARMHEKGISHGDLTTNNIVMSEKPYLIDTSLGSQSAEDGDLATDLFLLTESFKSNHSDFPELEEIFIRRYCSSMKDNESVMIALNEIQGRRRYV